VLQGGVEDVQRLNQSRHGMVSTSVVYPHLPRSEELTRWVATLFTDASN
jgi:hypothetical protein